MYLENLNQCVLLEVPTGAVTQPYSAVTQPYGTLSESAYPFATICPLYSHMYSLEALLEAGAGVEWFITPLPSSDPAKLPNVWGLKDRVAADFSTRYGHVELPWAMTQQSHFIHMI